MTKKIKNQTNEKINCFSAAFIFSYFSFCTKYSGVVRVMGSTQDVEFIG